MGLWMGETFPLTIKTRARNEKREKSDGNPVAIFIHGLSAEEKKGKRNEFK